MDNIEYIIEMALSNQHAGRLEEAVKIYNKVLEIDPKQSDAIYLLGMIACSKEDYPEAVRLINEAILLNPIAANYHADLSSRGAINIPYLLFIYFGFLISQSLISPLFI